MRSKWPAFADVSNAHEAARRQVPVERRVMGGFVLRRCRNECLLRGASDRTIPILEPAGQMIVLIGGQGTARFPDEHLHEVLRLAASLVRASEHPLASYAPVA